VRENVDLPGSTALANDLPPTFCVKRSLEYDHCKSFPLFRCSVCSKLRSLWRLPFPGVLKSRPLSCSPRFVTHSPWATLFFSYCISSRRLQCSPRHSGTRGIRCADVAKEMCFSTHYLLKHHGRFPDSTFVPLCTKYSRNFRKMAVSIEILPSSEHMRSPQMAILLKTSIVIWALQNFLCLQIFHSWPCSIFEFSIGLINSSAYSHNFLDL